MRRRDRREDESDTQISSARQARQSERHSSVVVPLFPGLEEARIPAESTRTAVWHRPSVIAISVALLFALAARLPYFVSSDFPLNDGGMFYAMSKDLLDAHFSLPRFTSYNFEAIPFAYPPLSFYLVAVINWATGLPMITLVRYLPLIANLGAVVAVFFLGRSLLGPGLASTIAPTIFVLIPRSYEWLIMGGGLTRSVGFLCALISLAIAADLFKRPTLRRALLSGVFAAAAMGAHLEEGVFVLYSLVLMAIFWGRRLRVVPLVYAVAAPVALLTAPWWITVINLNGLGPFDAARLTNGWSTINDDLAVFQANMFPPDLFLRALGVSATVGALAWIFRADLFLPLWLPSVYIWLPRSAPTEASVPMALLAAVGLGKVVWPGMLRAVDAARGWNRQSAVRSVTPQLPTSRLSWAMEALGMLLLLGAVYLYSPTSHPNPYVLDSLSPANRQAMRWISDNTPRSAQFLVLSTTWTWETDSVGEWFPVLAGRKSVLTVQGSEWLPSQLFTRKRNLFDQVRYLTLEGKGIDALDSWSRDHGISYSYIFISKEVLGAVDWSKIVASAEKSPNYRVLIDNASVVLLQRKEPIKPLWAPPGQVLETTDGQTLADQPPQIQKQYETAYGRYAAWTWVDQHQQSIGVPTSICSRLSQLGIGQVGPVILACRDDLSSMSASAADYASQLAEQNAGQ